MVNNSDKWCVLENYGNLQVGNGNSFQALEDTNSLYLESQFSVEEPV